MKKREKKIKRETHIKMRNSDRGHGNGSGDGYQRQAGEWEELAASCCTAAAEVVCFFACLMFLFGRQARTGRTAPLSSTHSLSTRGEGCQAKTCLAHLRVVYILYRTGLCASLTVLWLETLLLCFRCSTLPAAAAAHRFLVSISHVLRLLTSVSTLLVRCTASTLAFTSGANAEFK